MSNIVKPIFFQPLNDPDFTSILSSFSLLFQSSLGPHGKLKIVITAGGYFVVTSSSIRLISNIVIENPICLFISQVIKSQLTAFKDCGLYTGVFLSDLLKRALIQDSLSTNTYSLFLEQINADIFYILNSLKIEIDFSTVNQLLPLVRSILCSKPACCLSKFEQNLVSVAIVKVFLNSVNEDVGVINVICKESCVFDKPSIVLGCLYQTDDEICNSNLDIFTRHKCKELLIVVNIMLSNENPTKQALTDRVTLEEEQLFDVEKALQFLELAVKHGVSIVACQKVVHPWLKLYLRRNGILLLDRMGTELTYQVTNISGAIPISDITIKRLEGFMGYVDKVQRVSWSGKTYIALERNDKNVSTMLVNAVNSEAKEELKITVEKALYALRCILANPLLMPGCGCTEMFMAANLHTMILQKWNKKNYTLTGSQLQACVRWLQMSLLSSAGLLRNVLDLKVDTAYFHAWHGDIDSTESSCLCGLVTFAMVSKKHEVWSPLNLNSEILFPTLHRPHSIASADIKDGMYLDLYASKCNALKLCLDGCVALLSIGLIMNTKST